VFRGHRGRIHHLPSCVTCRMLPKVKTVTAIDHDGFNTFFVAPNSVEVRENALLAVNVLVAGESLEVRKHRSIIVILYLIERVS
jgi:hypothetical protein